jgi:hypothetical protein
VLYLFMNASALSVRLWNMSLRSGDF